MSAGPVQTGSGSGRSACTGSLASAAPPLSVRLASSLFACATHALPRASRRVLAADLETMFAQLAGEAHRTRGVGAVTRVLAFSLFDLFSQVRRERREPATSVAPRPQTPRQRKRPMSNLRTDLRHAVLSLIKSPAYSAIVLATLALGIGANTAIFSLVNAVLLTPLGYEEPDRIVVFWGTEDGVVERGGTLAYLNFIDVRAASDAFEHAAAYDEWRTNLTGSGEPERINGAQVNVEFFDVFRAQPAVGRFFAADEDIDGNDRVVVLSHGFWTRKFGRDPKIVGSSIELNGNAHVVVGVARADFEDPRLSSGAWANPEMWRPLGYGGLPLENQPNRGSSSFVAVGRLRDGVALDTVQAQVDALMVGLVEQYAENLHDGDGMVLVPIRETMIGESRASLLILLAAVALVLAIAAVNVAGLMMSRAADRSRETAVRLALGASRGRLLQLHLSESLVLAIAGGALGMVTAYALIGVFMRIGASTLPRTSSVDIDATVLLFTAAISILAGIVCGLAPLGRALRADPQTALRAGGRTGGAGADSLARRGLVMAEVALAVVLLVGATLLLRSFMALSGVDLGMKTDDTLVFDVSLPFSSYPEVADHERFYTEVLGRLEANPAVLAAGTTHVLPLSTSFDSMGAYAADGPEPDGEDGPSPQTRTVMPGYLDAMGMQMISGRWLSVDDTADTEFVVVINERFAEEVWPGQDPLGRQIITWREEPLRVVGVVGNVQQLAVDEVAPSAMYVALPQGIMYWHGGRANIVVRTADEPLALVDAAREAVRAVDANLPVADFRTMNSVLATNLRAPRFRALLIGAFAATALILAALGVYGVVAFQVSRQLRNVAIRIALGADTARVLRHVLAAGLTPVAIGTGAGLIAALAASRAIETLLFNTAPLDPITFVVVPVLLMAVATAACWLPARRASRVDPMATLRDD
jgi:predicted permease